MTRLTVRSLRFNFPMFLILLIGCSRVEAQTDCPKETQQKASNGVTIYGAQNTANIQVVVVDTSAGAFDDTQVQDVRDAITGIAAIPGSNQDSNTTNTDTVPPIPNPVTAADVANPINVVETGTAAQIASLGCTINMPNGEPPSACTKPYVDGNGHTYYSMTIVLDSAVESGQLEPLITHELGNADLGTNDCTGANCTNSISDPLNTNPAPTQCDKNYAATCDCKK